MNPNAYTRTSRKNGEPLTHPFQVGVYFSEVDHGEKIKYVPRSVQVDLEDGVLNRVSFPLKCILALAIRGLLAGYPADRSDG